MSRKPLGRIMVVDDERATLTPLCDILSEIGYEVACFVSAKEALEVYDGTAFDLILVDLMMPQMDGIAFMKAAQATDPMLVCVIVTGHATVETAVEAMKEGAFDYMTKPLNWKTLPPVLSRAIEVRRLRKSEEQYRSVVEDQTELINRSTPDGTITFVNEAFCRYFSKTRDELIGQSYLPFIPVEDHDRLKETFCRPEQTESCNGYGKSGYCAGRRNQMASSGRTGPYSANTIILLNCNQ